MDRDQAEKALGIIRGVIENTREDLVEHNWGMVWLIHAFTNALGFAAVGYLIERNGYPVFWYLAPLACVAAINLIFVAIFTERDQGTRSFVEWQVHGIWTTFILASFCAVSIIHVAGLPAWVFCPLVCLLTAFAFAMMAVVFYRRFFAIAVGFVAVTMIVSNPSLNVTRWYITSFVWWLAIFIPGVILFKARKQRIRGDKETTIL